jgi:hypothetical protein
MTVNFQLNDPQKCITEIENWHAEVNRTSNTYEGVQRVPEDMGYDPMRYFEILRHLRKPDGKQLKFVHSGARNGRPFLYWDDFPLPPDDEVIQINSIQMHANHDAVGSLIGVDGSAQGYFECAVFQALAAKVLLRWHAHYHDLKVICDRDALVKHVTEATSIQPAVEAMRPETGRRALLLDPTPVVNLSNSDYAFVDILTFNSWGGYKRMQYKVARSFPNLVSKSDEKTVLAYDCLVTF